MSAVQAVMTFAKFLALIGPALHAYAKALFKRHNGNPAEARDEIRRIADHGVQLADFEANINRKMAELEQQRATVAAERERLERERRAAAEASP